MSIDCSCLSLGHARVSAYGCVSRAFFSGRSNMSPFLMYQGVPANVVSLSRTPSLPGSNASKGSRNTALVGIGSDGQTTKNGLTN